MPSYIYERQAFYQWTDQARDKLAAGTDALPPAVLGALDRRLRNLDGTGRVFPTTHSFDEALSAGVPADDAKGFKDHRARILEEARDPAAPGLGDLNFRFSVILAVGGLAATVFGGWLGDRLRDRGLPGAYALVCGWSAIAGVPCFLAVLVAPFPWAWGLLFAAVFCLFRLHRAEQHDPCQRRPPGRPLDRVRRQYFSHPPARGRHLAVGHRPGGRRLRAGRRVRGGDGRHPRRRGGVAAFGPLPGRRHGQRPDPTGTARDRHWKNLGHGSTRMNTDCEWNL